MSVLTIILMLIVYFVFAIVVYIINPMISRCFDWDDRDGHVSALTSLFWPVFIGGVVAFYILKYPVKLLLGYPLLFLLKLRKLVENYYSDEAIQKRKIEKISIKEKNKTRVIEDQDLKNLSSKKYQEETLLYREVHCSGCGQSLRKNGLLK